MARGSRRGGLERLSISNGTASDAVAKLIDLVTGTSFREVYVRANTSAEVSGIALGEYELLFSSGQVYVRSTKKFIRNASYSKFDDHLHHTETREPGGTRFMTYRVTLDKVAYGTASTSAIDESAFDK
jgi:hypothetical protein